MVTSIRYVKVLKMLKLSARHMHIELGYKAENQILLAKKIHQSVWITKGSIGGRKDFRKITNVLEHQPYIIV